MRGFLARLLLSGWVIFLPACAGNSPEYPTHLAFLGIPSDPPPVSAAPVLQAIKEVERLGPDRAFLVLDWQKLEERADSAAIGEISEALRQIRSRYLWVKLIAYPRRRNPVVRYFRQYDLDFVRVFVLDSRDSTEHNRISARQLRWLQKLAEKKSSVPAIVLVDRALWDGTRFGNAFQWWQHVHPLLVRLHARWVMATETAGFVEDTLLSGITYLRSAGVTRTFSGEFHGLGYFPHFLWMVVKRGTAKATLILPGTAVVTDTVTASDVKRAQMNDLKALSHPDFPVPQKLPRYARRTVRVRIKNPLSEGIRGQLVWELPTRGWRIYPGEISYELKPGEERQFGFNVWMVAPSSVVEALPVLATEMPPLEGQPPRKIWRWLTPLRQYAIKYRRFRVEIDGDLGEWARSTPWTLHSEAYLVGKSGFRETDLSALLYLAWDTTGLYLAADVEDQTLQNRNSGEKIRLGDCLEIAIDGKLDRSVAGFDDNDFHLGFAFTSNGPVCWRWHAPPGMGRGRQFDIPFAVQRIPGHTLYEVFLPASELPGIPLREGTRIGVSVAIHDSDGRGWEGAIVWTPGLVGTVYPAAFVQVSLVR